jgi:hypothetical protein
MKENRDIKSLTNRTWFSRRREGTGHREQKDNPWKLRPSGSTTSPTKEDSTTQYSQDTKTMALHEASMEEEEEKVEEEEVQGKGEGNANNHHKTNTSDHSNKNNRERIIEAVVFVPHTCNSTLKKNLQMADNTFAATHNQPRLRFVERSSINVAKEAGRTDCWAGDWICGSSRCRVRTYIGDNWS